MATIGVRHAGFLTTVQDLGRWGWQSYGVPVSGVMDTVSHRLANAFVGNDLTAATLEVTLQGPELEFDDDRLVAVCGAEFALSLDGISISEAAPVRVTKGTRLRFGDRRKGSRAYVGISGGIDVPRVLGSRATHVPTRTGGLSGRALKAGDTLPLDTSVRGLPAAGRHSSPAWRELIRLPNRDAKVRILETPESDRCGAGALEQLTSNVYAVSGESDRMGYRLSGPALGTSKGTLLSEATVQGAIQVPPDGIPIVLEADRQTTGGYPKLAVVIAADLGLLGQLAPGDTVAFSACRREDALAALVALERRLMAIEALNDR